MIRRGIPVLLLTFAASADVVFLKDGSRFEGTVVPSDETGMAVLSTPDLAQAKGIDLKGKQGWKVEVRGDAAEITLPKAEIEEVVDPSHDATPLLQALEHPDKRVRYAAARSLAGMRPTRAFTGADKVVRNLADAVGEAGIRVVLVVSDDADLGNRMAARVRSAQYIPVLATSATECLLALKRSPGKDAILLDAGLGRKEMAPSEARKEEQELISRIDKITHYQAGDKDLAVEKRYARELFLRLQEDYRARSVPVLVIAEDAEVDLVKRIYEGKRVADVLPKSSDETRVKGALEILFQRDDPSLRDSKDLADDASLSACRALSGLSRNDPVFRTADAEEALIRAFSESAQFRRVDAVRCAALDAAASIGSPACYDEILKVLGQPSNTVEVRRAAVRALASIAKAAGVRCPDAVVAGLREAVKDADPGVWGEAAKGLGLSQLDSAQIRDVLAQERLEKPLK